MKRYRLSKLSILRWILLNNLVFLAIWILIFDIFKINVSNMFTLPLVGVFYIWIVILYPLVKYVSWTYYIDDRFIEIKYGIIYRKAVCIPINRIKYIDLVQEPIAMILKIKIVKIYTAGGKVVIPGVGYKMATSMWNLVRIHNSEV